MTTYDDIRSCVLDGCRQLLSKSRNAAIVPSITENYGNRLYSTSFSGTRTIKGVREGYSTRNRRFTSSLVSPQEIDVFSVVPGVPL